MKNTKRLIQSIIFSIAAHAVLTALLLTHPRASAPLQEKLKTVEVELLGLEQITDSQPSTKKELAVKKGQIVEQSARLNDEKPKDARFLSQHDQTVVRETQARTHGKFFNGTDSSGSRAKPQSGGQQAAMNPAAKPMNEVPASENSLAESADKPDKTDNQILSTDGPAIVQKSTNQKPSLRDLTPSFKPGPLKGESESLAESGGGNPSATDDHLKNVQTGMQTLLSTREFVYYSYYNRIKDKLRQTWEPKIKEKMERIFRQGRTIASTSDRVTKVIIVLDAQGILRKVQVIGPSGVHDLDDAAVEAFRAAAPFPNPPRGIIDSDGTIKIRWDFILEANANGLIDALNSPKKVM